MLHVELSLKLLDIEREGVVPFVLNVYPHSSQIRTLVLFYIRSAVRTLSEYVHGVVHVQDVGVSQNDHEVLIGCPL